MTRKKLIKTIALSTIGALMVAGIVAISILTAKTFEVYGRMAEYNDKMLVYEKDPKKPYEKKGTPEYEDYQAIKALNIEANKEFANYTTPLPYVGTATFLFAGYLIFQGVSTLAHSNVRSREN